MKLTLATLMVITALVMSGCRDWFPPVDPGPPGGGTPPAGLSAKRWVVSDIYNNGLVETLNPLTGYIEFDDAGTMTAFGGFNTLTANYAMANGSIAITNVTTTGHWGDTTEARFFDILSRSIRYKFDAFDDLELYTDRVDEKLTFNDRTDTLGIFGGAVKKVQFGQSFKLFFDGDYAELEGDAPFTYFTVSGLIGDSRCPANVTCAQAGDASVAVSLIQGGYSYSGEVHTNSAFGSKTTTLGAYDVTLVGLTPLPEAGVAPNPAMYTAELRVTRH